MKKSFISIFSCLILCCGCSSTKAIITEYDSTGKIVKKTETSTSIVSEVVASTKGKTVIAWESGWAAYISVSTATQQDPTPTGKMFAGKTDKGLISTLPDQQNWEGIAAAINATKYELNVNASGISGTTVKENK